MTALPVVLSWMVAVAAPLFFCAGAVWLALAHWREEGPGLVNLPYALDRAGTMFLRAGWLALGLVTLLLYFLWPSHPVAGVVAGPDRFNEVIRLFNVAEYMDWWQTYVGYGSMVEPLLLWAWGVWLLLSAALRLLFGLTTRG